MTAPSKDEIASILNAIRDPATGRGLINSGVLQGLVIQGGKAGFMLDVPAGTAGNYEPVRAEAERAVRAMPGITAVTAVLTSHGAPAAKPAPRPAPAGAQGIPGIRHIVAVASGKGGVGKSTVAANLALALAALGQRVGLMDADIYGPSVPHLLGITEKPHAGPDKRLLPVTAHGIKAMSIGLLIDPNAAAVWRGPVATGALNQLLAQVAWDDLDILLIDMPPGTGDIHISLTQRVALAGAVVVSTPQDVALLDARKGITMFQKVSVPVLGIVENMSTHICSNCGHEEHLFGHGGARLTADELGVPFLGEIPLHLAIRTGSDDGAPVVAADPGGPQARPFFDIAARVLEGLDKGAVKPPPRIVFV
ncbi:MAG: iron-sulfur cluster carrier protein ApbC [Micropepsaceae bacterium]